MIAGRRAVLLALAGAPFVALATARTMKRVVVLESGAPEEWRGLLAPFVQALGTLGFAEGRTVEIVCVGWMADIEERTPQGIARWIAQKVLPLEPDVVLTDGPILTYAFRLASTTVPVVTSGVPDPVAAGLARSLARPGGNVTGLAQGLEDTSAKSAELLKRLLPRLTRVAIFCDSRPMGMRVADLYGNAAKRAGIEPVFIASTDGAQLLDALRGLRARRILAGIWVFGAVHPREVAGAALAARVPLIAIDDDWVRRGCLASYSAFEPSPYPRLAAIVAQVLRGATPAEIPFQNPERFRLAINRRTAAALGIAVPQDLLLRADQVFD